MKQNASIKPEAQRLINQDLSWLEFNGLLLEEALEVSNPLLERVKLFCVFGDNLDGFFETRVAGLKQRSESPVSRSPGWIERERDVARHQSARSPTG